LRRNQGQKPWRLVMNTLISWNREAKYLIAFCWTDVRPKWLVAKKSYPGEAGATLNLIDELFRGDRKAALDSPDEGEDSLGRVRRLRGTESRWVVKALGCWQPS